MAEADGGKGKEAKQGVSLPVLITLVIGAIVVQVGVLFILFRLFLTPNPAPAFAPSPEAEQVAASAASGQLPSGVIVPVEDLVVNPRGSSSRYVLVALGLEVADGKQAEHLRQELMIPIRDRIMSVVTSYSIEELQAAGIRDSLRARIREELSRVLPGVQIHNVYFSKFVIQ